MREAPVQYVREAPVHATNHVYAEPAHVLPTAHVAPYHQTMAPIHYAQPMSYSYGYHETPLHQTYGRVL